MTDADLAALVSKVEPLRACFVVDARSGALRSAYRRDEAPEDPERVARAVAGLARAQSDLVGLAGPAEICTLQWPDAVVIVRSGAAGSLVAFFFDPAVTLGAARMHTSSVLERLEGEPEGDAPRAAELLAHLSAQVPDVHAALLRVSLQTGLPLSRLESPQTLTEEEFERVTASVRRILGTGALPD